jgi:hypothetical protein
MENRVICYDLADGTVEGTADGEMGFYGVRGEGFGNVLRDVLVAPRLYEFLGVGQWQCYTWRIQLYWTRGLGPGETCLGPSVQVF